MFASKLNPAAGAPGHFSIRSERLPLAEQTRQLLHALDPVGIGIAIFDDAGELVHANRLMREVLAEASAELEIRPEVENYISSLVALRRERRGAPADDMAALTVREVGTPESCWRLRGSWIEDRSRPGTGLLLILERVLLPPAGGMRILDRFGLTQQEKRIARLLAEGRSNAEIVEELHISPHTARNHTRKVLQKLGIHSRAQVVNKLLQEIERRQ